jgi:hypothetical protein
MPFHNPFLSGIKDTRNLKLFTAAIDELLSLTNACNEWFPLRKNEIVEANPAQFGQTLA